MSAMDGTIGSSIRGSLVVKFTLTAISTIIAYILVPVAFDYAVGDLTEMLVLAIVVIWALALTRMWGEVISLAARAVARIPVSAVTDIGAGLPRLGPAV